MQAANLSKEWSEADPSHSLYLFGAKQLNRERNLRSQLCDLT